MPARSFPFTRPLLALAMVAGSTLYAVAQQAPTPSRVRGTLEKIDGDTLDVKSRSGEELKLHSGKPVQAPWEPVQPLTPRPTQPAGREPLRAADLG